MNWPVIEQLKIKGGKLSECGVIQVQPELEVQLASCRLGLDARKFVRFPETLLALRL